MSSGEPPSEATNNIITTAAQGQGQGPTLLPRPIANAVSLATRSTSLAIRLGSLVGSYGIDAARFTTLSSLELARGLVEVVLTRAGKDTTDIARSGLAAADAESVLEKSLETLHYAVIQVVFWTSASFRLGSTSLLVASETSQLVLSSLDQLLGSTDSSRAVASIITLIRREFRSPATGNKQERVGVTDMILALSALAYLQQSCYKITEEEQRRQSYEEVIWDVVVLNDGQRVDVDDETALQRGYNETYNAASLNQPVPPEEDEAVLARLKSQIISSLPSNTTVSIANTVSTIQTITVDVDGPELLTLPTPPGAEIVETSTRQKPARNSWFPSFGGGNEQSSYRVVYKIEREKFRSMVFQGDDAETGSVLGEVDGDELVKPDIRFDAASGTFSSAKSGSSSPDDDHLYLTPWDRAVEAKEGPATRSPAVGPRSSSYGRSGPTEASKEPVANEKKQRTPPSFTAATESSDKRQAPSTMGDKPPAKKKKTDPSPQGRSTDKKGSLKQVLKGGHQSISNIWNKDGSEASNTTNKQRSQWKAPDRGGPSNTQPNKLKPLPAKPPRPGDHNTLANRRSAPTPDPLPRSSSRASYVSIQDHRRNSVVSQTDTYSMNSAGLRPASPSIRRSDISSSHENSVWPRHEPSTPRRGHRRNAPSLYSLATNDSQSSLILSSYNKKSAYSATDALDTLRREGFVDGTFPAGHLLPNITRYMRFSSACYGSHFLKFMGISQDMPTMKEWDHMHKDVRHFAHHTESDAGNILLASFVDPQGGTDSTGATGTGVPLVHYISLDHEAKAVVLACRGTLGFEDVLTDMTCDFDYLVWRGRRYKVHKGMHASARRLLYGGDGRVLVTLKEALEEFPEYGLVLCGHSLGAGVTSLLGLMLSEPNHNGPGFVTASGPVYPKMLTDGGTSDTKFSDIRVPSGRRIHVYAYGPPGVMSSPLRKITKGLITSVVHGSDLVPHLSLGLLHDFQALSLAFKHKENRIKTEIRARMWAAFQDNLSGAPRVPSNDEHIWMLPALNALRDTMKSEKLLPPGEVFTIESQKVLRRDAFVVLSEGHLGRPALRVVLKYIRDVEGRFGEVRFGTSMLTDHSPANYENALNKLKLGVAD